MTRGPQPHPGIGAIRRYRGGRSDFAGVARPVKLSANETPLGPGPQARRAAARAGRAGAGLARYPDGGHRALRKALGRHHRIDPERIVCGAGTDELLHLLAGAYLAPGREAIHSAHGFALYPNVIRAAGARAVRAAERDWRTDVDAILSRVTARTRAVFVSNPNNPTSTALPFKEMARLHAGLRSAVLLIVDEAYAEYAEALHSHQGGGYGSMLPVAHGADNLVVLRTFSKVYGLAGLRVGWAYAPAPVADILNRVRGPFNVCAPGQAAAHAALGERAHLARALAHNCRWLPWLAERLRACGIEVPSSAANFLLLRFPGTTRAAQAARAARAFGFLARRGLIVREMGEYNLPHCLRVSIGRARDNRAVAAAVKRFMEQEAGR